MVMSKNQFCIQSIASKKTRKAEEKTKGYMCSYVRQIVAMCGKMPVCSIIAIMKKGHTYEPIL